VAVLDSSVPPVERRRLITERRDQVKVFLMTSSGARGVSFPKTDWIIAQMPRFAVEAGLMEVAQLIYRGRGGSYASDDGTVHASGDWKDRHLTFLVQDFLPVDTEPDPRQWLRRVTDLLTFLVMLRATVHTRICGDAALDKQRLALVPVGGIGADELLSLMSTQARRFLSECDIVVRDGNVGRDVRGLVAMARDRVYGAFSAFKLVGTARTPGLRSVLRLHDVARFSELAGAENGPLLPDVRENSEALLPETLYCVGPFWLEDWHDLDTYEQFNVEGWLTDIDREIGALLSDLVRIKNLESVPKLRAPAAELYRILAREKSEATREFSTVKALSATTTWLAMPLDYPRFWKKDEEGRYPGLVEHDRWHSALTRCLGSGIEVLPVIPRYDDQEVPYVAIVGSADPVRLRLVFDDRYMAVSDELNLLNTILLGDGGGEAKSAIAG
jgi:hypothetical protein